MAVLIYGMDIFYVVHPIQILAGMHRLQHTLMSLHSIELDEKIIAWQNLDEWATIDQQNSVIDQASFLSLYNWLSSICSGIKPIAQPSTKNMVIRPLGLVWQGIIVQDKLNHKIVSKYCTCTKFIKNVQTLLSI